MLFNSLDFAIFLPIVFCIYWFLANINQKWQNVVIVAASYIFYGWWDWRFLTLIFFSTLIDFFVGNLLKREPKIIFRKLLLCLSLTVNLGFLVFFKYYNFFLDNFTTAFSFFGTEISSNSLNIILPVGISFYTFQTLSYTIDVYKKKLTPTNDFIAFSAFVCFFPQLVAGPIERATHLLPQFYTKRKFEFTMAVDGMRQMLWGFFKKMVIADNSAEFANQIFANSQNLNGSSLLIGAIFFSFQIYCDFSGYSDIAIGTSRLFGFDLKQNFAFPYFSRDIAEFWRRWHISLSTWFRDYLYIPLGGSKGKIWSQVRNIFIIFIVSGFWHGANWTFIVWGVLNALYFLPLLLFKQNRRNIDIIASGKLMPTFRDFFRMVLTFFLTVLAWIFFRAESVTHALQYISVIFSKSFFSFPDFTNLRMALIIMCLILVMITIEWLGRENKYAIENIDKVFNRPFRWVLYSTAIFLIGVYSPTNESPFIYFQF